MDVYFSIVIATYRRPEMLMDAIRSVVMQTVVGDEVIIVNDDRLQSISVNEFSSKVSIYDNLGANGAAASRNFGVQKAKNEYVVFLDDDDLMVQGYLSSLRRLIKEKRGASWGRCEIEIFTRNGFSFETYQAKRLESCVWEKVSNSAEKLFGAGCGFWIKRELFFAVGGFDEGLSNSEDIDLCCRLERANQEVYKVNQVGVLVRQGHTQGAENLTKRTGNLEKLQCWFSVYKKNRNGRFVFNKIRMLLLERCVRRGIKVGFSHYIISWMLKERNDILVLVFIPIFLIKLLKSKLAQHLF